MAQERYFQQTQTPSTSAGVAATAARLPSPNMAEAGAALRDTLIAHKERKEHLATQQVLNKYQKDLLNARKQQTESYQAMSDEEKNRRLSLPEDDPESFVYQNTQIRESIRSVYSEQLSGYGRKAQDLFNLTASEHDLRDTAWALDFEMEGLTATTVSVFEEQIQQASAEAFSIAANGGDPVAVTSLSAELTRSIDVHPSLTDGQAVALTDDVENRVAFSYYSGGLQNKTPESFQAIINDLEQNEGYSSYLTESNRNQLINSAKRGLEGLTAKQRVVDNTVAQEGKSLIGKGLTVSARHIAALSAIAEQNEVDGHPDAAAQWRAYIEANTLLGQFYEGKITLKDVQSAANGFLDKAASPEGLGENDAIRAGAFMHIHNTVNTLVKDKNHDGLSKLLGIEFTPINVNDPSSYTKRLNWMNQMGTALAGTTYGAAFQKTTSILSEAEMGALAQEASLGNADPLLIAFDFVNTNLKTPSPDNPTGQLGRSFVEQLRELEGGESLAAAYSLSDGGNPQHVRTLVNSAFAPADTTAIIPPGEGKDPATYGQAVHGLLVESPELMASYRLLSGEQKRAVDAVIARLGNTVLSTHSDMSDKDVTDTAVTDQVEALIRPLLGNPVQGDAGIVYLGSNASPLDRQATEQVLTSVASFDDFLSFDDDDLIPQLEKAVGISDGDFVEVDVDVSGNITKTPIPLADVLAGAHLRSDPVTGTVRVLYGANGGALGQVTVPVRDSDGNVVGSKPFELTMGQVVNIGKNLQNPDLNFDVTGVDDRAKVVQQDSVVGGNLPGFAPDVTPPSGTDGFRKAMEPIIKGEGGKSSQMNSQAMRYYPQGFQTPDVTRMPVNDVIELGKQVVNWQYRPPAGVNAVPMPAGQASSALGLFQMTYTNLQNMVDSGAIDGDAPFNAETQTKAAIELIKGVPAITSYFKADAPTTAQRNKAMDALASQWVSIPNSQGALATNARNGFNKLHSSFANGAQFALLDSLRSAWREEGL